MIELTPPHLLIVRRILESHTPGYDVFVFGSRIKGTAKPYSDLDLAVRGKEKLSSAQLSALRESFEESVLPFRVDVVDFWAVSPEFRAIIEHHHERMDTGQDRDW